MARGPIIYCVEDADNEWETNHFKDVLIASNVEVKEEERVANETTGEKYIALHTTGWSRSVSEWESKPAGSAPGIVEEAGKESVQGVEHPLVFVPYYYRANRGGRGHMRVGLNAA